MSHYVASPGNVHGVVHAVASKSDFQRAVGMSVLSDHSVTLNAKNLSDDCNASLSIAHDLGSKIEKSLHRVVVYPRAEERKKDVICGESGLSFRLFAAVASVGNIETTLHATGSLAERPVSMIEAPLLKLGVRAVSNNGFPPVTLRGALRGGDVEIDGSITSQFLTGLLISLPVLQKDSVIHVSSLKSIPYISMTLKLLADFGIHIEHQNFETFFIKGNQRYSTDEITIEGDWSGAAAFLVAGALAGEVKVFGLAHSSLQADRAIIDVLRNVGAKVIVQDDYVIVQKQHLKCFRYDATHSPDLFPVLAALATQCDGVSIIKGVSRLFYKESDRAKSIVSEFGKAGVRIVIQGDEMIIYPSQIKKLVKLSSCNDHRMVFALTLLGLVSEEGIHIEDPQCVTKSYPDFFPVLDSIFQKR